MTPSLLSTIRLFTLSTISCMLFINCHSFLQNGGLDSKKGLIVQVQLQERIHIYKEPRSKALSFHKPDHSFPWMRSANFSSGLDVLAHANFSLIRGKKVALLAHHASRDASMTHILELLRTRNLVPQLLLEPEHGLYSARDEPGPHGIRKHAKTGARILSLFNKKGRKPEAKNFKGIDLILVDLINLPIRCYTYISTLSMLMEMAAEHDIEILILDRPNYYGFWKARGNALRKKYSSFTSYASVPFLYSMTLGEYAFYMAATRLKRLRLSVVMAGNYNRRQTRGILGMPWLNPSPNIPNPETAMTYPGMVFFEGTNFSLGRGTTRPFIYSGSPWLKNKKVLREMRKLKLKGLRMNTVQFIPKASEYKGQVCRGLQISPESMQMDPLRFGYEYMRLVRRMHPKLFRFKKSKISDRYFIDLLWGGPEYRNAIESDLKWATFEAGWMEEAQKFEERVKPYRLY